MEPRQHPITGTHPQLDIHKASYTLDRKLWRDALKSKESMAASCEVATPLLWEVGPGNQPFFLTYCF